MPSDEYKKVSLENIGQGVAKELFDRELGVVMDTAKPSGDVAGYACLMFHSFDVATIAESYLETHPLA